MMAATTETETVVEVDRRDRYSPYSCMDSYRGTGRRREENAKKEVGIVKKKQNLLHMILVIDHCEE